MTPFKKTQGNHSLLKVDSTLVSLHGYPQFFINVQPGLQITPQGDVSTIEGSALGFKVGEGSFAQYPIPPG
jgi:hypothetical protein